MLGVGGKTMLRFLREWTATGLLGTVFPEKAMCYPWRKTVVFGQARWIYERTRVEENFWWYSIFRYKTPGWAKPDRSGWEISRTGIPSMPGQGDMERTKWRPGGYVQLRGQCLERVQEAQPCKSGEEGGQGISGKQAAAPGLAGSVPEASPDHEKKQTELGNMGSQGGSWEPAVLFNILGSRLLFRIWGKL